MRALIEACREALLSAEDSICLERARLVTEAYQRWGDDPIPIRRAKALDHILANMTLDLESNPIFAGNTSSRPRAWMLLPEHGFTMPGQVTVEKPSLEGHLKGNAIPEDLRAFWKGRSAGGHAGIGHLAVNLERVLARGLSALVEEAESLPDEPDPAKAMYRRACALGCRAVIRWAGRYADAARRAAQRQVDPARAAALARVAGACSRVPAEPAGDFFEALQSVLLVHLAIHIEGHGYSVSPGRLDQVLQPYYRDDEDATDLLAGFMLKVSANSLWGSHSKTQCITLGGIDRHGRDQCNPLTMRFLEAWERVRTPDPHLFVRWHRGISADVKSEVVRMLAEGLSMPMLVGDAQTAAGLINAGVSETDAWNYCIVGCNELGIPGKLIYDTVQVNGVAVLRDVLLSNEGIGEVDSMDELLSRLGRRLREVLKERIAAKNKWRARRWKLAATPFTSSLMDGCVERGKDMNETLAYDLPTLTERGFTNLVNALAAIEQVAFAAGKAKLRDVARAVETNFRHPRRIRHLLRSAPKWGNDDDAADRWAQAWLALREQQRRSVEAELGSQSHLTAHVVRSLHHLEGRSLGATPDGRLAGEPLADSVGAQLGTASEGPTGVLNSVRKLAPARYWTGGYNLNITLPSLHAEGQQTLEKLRAMVDVFFDSGGQELQINCLDASVLEDARAHPEKHPDLLVRVAGFNARFVELGTAEQEELIRRASAAG